MCYVSCLAFSEIDIFNTHQGMIEMDVTNLSGFSSPEEAFRMAAELIREECEAERKLAMSQERIDRFNPDIKHFDYAASRMELLARRFDTWANLSGEPDDYEPPLIG